MSDTVKITIRHQDTNIPLICDDDVYIRIDFPDGTRLDVKGIKSSSGYALAVTGNTGLFMYSKMSNYVEISTIPEYKPEEIEGNRGKS